MYSDNYQNKTGKDRFQGFLLDLIEHLSQRLNFRYELYEVEDRNYGKRQDDGTWNGMIRDLIDGVSLARHSVTSHDHHVTLMSQRYSS